MTYSANISTAIKSRQPQVKDAQFAQALNRIVTTGPVVEDYSQFEEWKRDALQELNEAALEFPHKVIPSNSCIHCGRSGPGPGRGIATGYQDREAWQASV